MHATLGSPVAPPGVAPGSGLWITVTVVHLALWVSAIVQGALCVDLSYKHDSFKMLAMATLVGSGTTVLFAAIAAVLSYAAPRSMFEGVFGYLAAVTAAGAAGAYILLVIQVSDMRNAQLGHSLSAAGNISADELYNVQSGLLSAFVAMTILMRHEMASIAHKANGAMGGALVLTSM